MALTQYSISATDLQDKGVVGLPDTPALTTLEMQEKFDELALDVIVPKHNDLIDAMTALTGASEIGATNGSVQSELDAKANITDVIEKTNTDAFTPTANYHPATKKYVDDKLVEIGAGDMTKSVYDQDENGTVDDAEKLGGSLPAAYMTKAQYDPDETGVVYNENLIINSDFAIPYYGTEDLPAGKHWAAKNWIYTTVSGTPSVQISTNDGKNCLKVSGGAVEISYFLKDLAKIGSNAVLCTYNLDGAVTSFSLAEVTEGASSVTNDEGTGYYTLNIPIDASNEIKHLYWIKLELGSRFTGYAPKPQTVEEKAGLPTPFATLWSETWTSGGGALTVTGISRYRFIVVFATYGTAEAIIPCFALNGRLVGGVMTGVSSYPYSMMIDATIVGNTLSAISAKYMNHNVSGNHSAVSNVTLTKIVGVM